MDFSELLEEAKRGRQHAFSELHRRYQFKVLARVRDRLTPSLRRRYDTLDLSQSVFLEVLRDLPDFENRGERAFRNWLYIKAENKVRTKLRRQLGREGARRETTLEGTSDVLAVEPSAASGAALAGSSPT